MGSFGFMGVESKLPLPLVIFGVPFHNVTFAEVVEWVAGRVRAGLPTHIATANLDFVTRAWSDPELQRLLIDADLVIADGFPIVKLSPFFGPRLRERVTGSDLTPMLAERAAAEGFRVFGLGSSAGIAKKAMEILKQRYPRLKIAGTYAPPFAPLLEMDHREIMQRLDQANPDILFVALGVPKQEKFIGMHMHDWRVPVSIGVGASLDFIVGAQKRAPRWVRGLSLEWLWRICLDPRRLFSRYTANVRFLFSATRQMFMIHRMADKPVAFQPLEEAEVERLAALGAEVERFQKLDSEEAARQFSERLARADTGSIVLDIHPIPWLDSQELGALLESSKRCRANGKRLILYAPRPKVRRLLETCRLTDYFDIATRMDELSAILEKLAGHRTGGTVYEEGVLTLELPMELTAATLPVFEKQAEAIHLALREEKLPAQVRVDASRLDFIDSSGLGFLIALKKATQEKGVAMPIENLPAKPRRTFEITHVDKVLLGS